MRRQLQTLLPFVLLPVAVSCAKGFTFTEGGGSGAGGGATVITSSSSSSSSSSGFPVNTSSSGGSSGSTSSGGSGCGLSSSDPTCNACLDASCCNQALACDSDPGCTVCLGTSTPPASCDTNASLAALSDCLSASCTTACGGGSSSSGGAPTTCAGASDSIGCCGGIDETLYYCDLGTLGSDDCATYGLYCGWDDINGYYSCVDFPGEDPSGAYPFLCPGP